MYIKNLIFFGIVIANKLDVSEDLKRMLQDFVYSKDVILLYQFNYLLHR